MLLLALLLLLGAEHRELDEGLNLFCLGAAGRLVVLALSVMSPSGGGRWHNFERTCRHLDSERRSFLRPLVLCKPALKEGPPFPRSLQATPGAATPSLSRLSRGRP